jgi:hypothetical protein
LKPTHYTVYRVTNLLNQKIYIGVHVTKNLNDSYIGSGSALLRAIKKYGIENFKKEILFDFDNPEEMIAKEIELVDSVFVSRTDTYNIKEGGNYLTVDKVTALDANGTVVSVFRDDIRWKDGSLTGVTKNKVTAKHSDGSVRCVDIESFKDNTEGLVGVVKGYVTCVDCNGVRCMTTPDDVRIESGLLKRVGFWKGRKHSEDSKLKISEKNRELSKGCGNSQYGTCWINKEGQVLKIKKDSLESYLEKGWVRGRKVK